MNNQFTDRVVMLSDVVSEAEGKMSFVFAPDGTEIDSVMARTDTSVLLYLAKDLSLVKVEVLLTEEDNK